jgi:hypothetical protein
MQEKRTTNYSDEVSISEIINILLKKKTFIFVLTSFAAIGSVMYSLFLTNIYTSSALLTPSQQTESMASALGSYSALAGMAGINLASPGENKSLEALERIKSLDFFSNHFIPNINLQDIFAVESWDAQSNTLTYNEKIFDSSKNNWIRKVNFPLKTIPSNQEAYERYTNILSINEDKKTGFIIVSISHPSPYIAKEWTDIIIFNINESMREVDKIESINAIDFLKARLKTTKLSELRDALSRLLENQMQILMMASASEGYVFKVINSPAVPEKKSEPSRALICILGTFLGFIFSVFYSIFTFFYSKEV